MTKEESKVIVDLTRAYMELELHFTKADINLTCLFMEDFILTGHDRDWPMLHKSFPEMLRALAFFLEARNKIEVSR